MCVVPCAGLISITHCQPLHLLVATLAKTVGTMGFGLGALMLGGYALCVAVNNPAAAASNQPSAQAHHGPEPRFSCCVWRVWLGAGGFLDRSNDGQGPHRTCITGTAGWNPHASECEYSCRSSHTHLAQVPVIVAVTASIVMNFNNLFGKWLLTGMPSRVGALPRSTASHVCVFCSLAGLLLLLLSPESRKRWPNGAFMLGPDDSTQTINAPHAP